LFNLRFGDMRIEIWILEGKWNYYFMED